TRLASSSWLVVLLRPRAGEVVWLGRFEDVDVDDGDPRFGVALDVVEARRLLQLLLDPVGHLLHRVEGRGAGPHRLHDHGVDRELRILLAAELTVGHDARHPEDQHEEDHQRLVVDGPFGDVEALYWAATPVGSATFLPSANDVTPRRIT